jgi:hypothetical protein
MFERQDVCGFLHGVYLYFRILLLHQLGGIHLKRIRLCAADDECGHIETGESAPEIKITQTRQVDVSFPFGRVDEFVTAVCFWFGDACDINFQAFITHIAKDRFGSITAKQAFQIIERAPALFCRRNQRVSFFSQPDTADKIPCH